MNASDLSPEAAAILSYYQESGVHFAEAETPGGLWSWDPAAALPSQGAVAEKPAQAPRTGSRTVSGDAPQALAAAEAAAAACTSLEELVTAIEGFAGCPLRDGAMNTVVFDGILGADILIMGEAPGRDEDRMGKPFVGRSGQLLDRMLGSIGLARAPADGQRPVTITNVVFWRPPGNRNPAPAELAVCLPFARRFVTLTRPKIMLTVGKVPTEAFFPDVKGITRARGTWREFDLGNGTSCPTLPIFHPAFLLRQPAQKRWVWRDLLAVKAKLNETLS